MVLCGLKKSQFNKDLKYNYNKDNDEEYFLKVDVQYPGNLRNLHNDLLFLPKRKLKKSKNL